MTAPKRIGLVLAGGSGTRLWPVSRQEMPKQFLPLIGDTSLFLSAVARAQACCDLVVVVGAYGHRHIIDDQLRGVEGELLVFLEPTAR